MNRVQKPQREKFDYNKYNFTGLKDVLSILKKQNKNSISAAQKSPKSMKYLVENEGWPAGGLHELR
jgi:hypothetical protein